jgi:hypothetical protein
MKALVKKILKKFYLRLQITIDLIKNVVLLKTLKVYKADILEKVVIEGAEIIIHFKTKGCHKIKIKGLGTFRGNVKELKFQFVKELNPIKIKFNGFSKSIEKQFNISSSSIKVLNNFETESYTPILSELSIGDFRNSMPNNLKCTFSKGNLKTVFSDISIKFDEFDQSLTNNLTKQ